LFVSTHRKRDTIGQFIIILTDPYGLPLGPVTHPFLTKPKIANSSFSLKIALSSELNAFFQIFYFKKNIVFSLSSILTRKMKKFNYKPV
jgi:hypothetical protein